LQGKGLVGEVYVSRAENTGRGVSSGAVKTQCDGTRDCDVDFLCLRQSGEHQEQEPNEHRPALGMKAFE
jgi:hypothetical protein